MVVCFDLVPCFESAPPQRTMDGKALSVDDQRLMNAAMTNHRLTAMTTKRNPDWAQRRTRLTENVAPYEFGVYFSLSHVYRLGRIRPRIFGFSDFPDVHRSFA